MLTRPFRLIARANKFVTNKSSSHARLMSTFKSSDSHLRDHYKLLKSQLNNANMWIDFYSNRGLEEDGYSLRNKANYQNLAASLHEFSKKALSNLTQHFLKTKYKTKTVQNEEELNSLVAELEKKKKQTIEADEREIINSEIAAIQQVLNPRFQTLVIGNRSWIAERLVKLAHKLALEPVILHMPIDRTTPAVQAVSPDNRIVVSKYDQVDEIKKHLLELKKTRGKIAFHPGIGFLAENSDFYEWCEENKIIFVGSPLRQFADKALAKELAEKAGVPIAKSYYGEKQDLKFLSLKAEEIGYPVAIKVSKGGGGGKLNRFANNEKEFLNAYTTLSPHGHLTLEKFIPNARHIEFNIFGCEKGEVFEVDPRDCSMQQRSQKGLEKREVEAELELTKPRRDIIELNQIAKKLGYTGSGTFEFLVDDKNNWYFMEMNARTQAEHPVTQKGIGIDVLEWGIRAFAGRDSSPFLKPHHEFEPNLNMKGKMWALRQKTQSVKVRQIRILAVDDILKNLPNPGEIFYTGLKGTVTRLHVPDTKGGGGEVMLSLQEGTKLDYIANPLDLQIGYIVGACKTQVEADLNAIELASKIELEVNGERKDKQLRHACETLLWLYETGAPELTTSWEKYNKEVYIPRKEPLSFEEILERFNRIALERLRMELEREERSHRFGYI